MKLTDEQLEVISNNDKKILVKAGAGTGKTEILTRRIIRLIEDDPELSIKDMAIITFTNKATEELQARLKKAFYNKWKSEGDIEKKMRFRYELETLNSAQISTIHKFCSSILETFGPYFDEHIQYSPAYKVGSDQLYKTIDQTIEAWIKDQNEKGKEIEHLKYMPVHRLKEVVKKAYSTFRTKGIDMPKILKGTRRSALLEMETTKKNLKLELIDLLERVNVNHQKYKYGQLDVDDLLEYCSKIISSRSDLCQYVQKKFKYIFIDEFQDTSLYQSEIVKRICDGSEKSPNLFVVGDVKQSIYEFRGADTNAYSKIEEWIKESGSILTLSTNWRSTPEIVHYVNYVFDRIKDNEKYHFKRDPLKPSAINKDLKMSDAYQWLLAGKDTNQVDLISDFLRKSIDKGVEANQFTILVRKNYELDIFAEKLNEMNIPFNIVDSGYFYNQQEIIDIYRVLKSILNNDDLISIGEASSSIFFGNNTDLYDTLRNKIDQEKLVFKYTPSQLIDFIYKETKILRRVSSQVRANLNKLKEKSRNIVRNENVSLYQYVNWLSTMIFGSVEEPLADAFGEDSKSVQLMTIHKSKGLEFPIVILPNLDKAVSESSLNPEITINHQTSSLEFYYEKYYQKGTSIVSANYEDTIKTTHFNVYSEELRVLYVALTRAKKKLILCGSKTINSNKICYQNWLLKD